VHNRRTDKKVVAHSTELGPSLRGIPFGSTPPGPLMRRLLTPRQQKLLASISTRVTTSPRQIVYRAEAPAAAVFICTSGALKTYRDLPSGKRRILAFIFPDDMCGLASNGRYVNTVEALTKTTLYQLPLTTLAPVLQQDAELQWQFLCKVAHELREAQRRAVLMSGRSATGRLATFIKLMETQGLPGADKDFIPLPMSRSDIADYLGLSLEAVSRATTQLQRDKVIAFDGTHLVRVLDYSQLDRLARGA
jgi:CRP-like cAMP-binding protein